MATMLFQVTADGLVVSWGAIGTMVAVSSAICSAAVAYLRVFVGSKLSAHEKEMAIKLAEHDTKLATFKGDLTREIQESSRQSFLGRHVGEMWDGRLKVMEDRLGRLESRES